MNLVIAKIFRAAFGTLGGFGIIATLLFAHGAWKDYWHQLATIGEYKCLFVSGGLLMVGGMTSVLVAWWWMFNNAVRNTERGR